MLNHSEALSQKWNESTPGARAPPLFRAGQAALWLKSQGIGQNECARGVRGVGLELDTPASRGVSPDLRMRSRGLPAALIVRQGAGETAWGNRVRAVRSTTGITVALDCDRQLRCWWSPIQEGKEIGDSQIRGPAYSSPSFYFSISDRWAKFPGRFPDNPSLFGSGYLDCDWLLLSLIIQPVQTTCYRRLPGFERSLHCCDSFWLHRGDVVGLFGVLRKVVERIDHLLFARLAM